MIFSTYEFTSNWLFLLILIYILCLWLAVPPPYSGRPTTVRRSSQPEANNADQNEVDVSSSGAGPLRGGNFLLPTECVLLHRRNSQSQRASYSRRGKVGRGTGVLIGIIYLRCAFKFLTSCLSLLLMFCENWAFH